MPEPHPNVVPLIQNCEHWCREHQTSLTVLAERIGRKHDFFSSLKRGTVPKMDVLLRLSEVTAISLDRLVSPTATVLQRRHDRSAFADQVLELASEFIDKQIGFHKPPARSVMNWLIENGSQIDLGDPMVAQIEIFREPDRSEPIPIPLVVGHQSLIAAEAGVKSPEHLTSLIQHSEKALMVGIGGDHLTAADGKPCLQRKTITLDTSTTRVSCDYDRLLAPARFNGDRVVVSYSVAINLRKGRVDHGNELNSPRGRQPVLSR